MKRNSSVGRLESLERNKTIDTNDRTAQTNNYSSLRDNQRSKSIDIRIPYDQVTPAKTRNSY